MQKPPLTSWDGRSKDNFFFESLCWNSEGISHCSHSACLSYRKRGEREGCIGFHEFFGEEGRVSSTAVKRMRQVTMIRSLGFMWQKDKRGWSRHVYMINQSGIPFHSSSSSSPLPSSGPFAALAGLSGSRSQCFNRLSARTSAARKRTDLVGDFCLM